MILERRPGSVTLGGLRGGTEAKIQLFQNMVMLHNQIKGNDACSYMVAYILPIDPPPDPRGWDQKVKIQRFQNTVTMHIKFKGMTSETTW